MYSQLGYSAYQTIPLPRTASVASCDMQEARTCKCVCGWNSPRRLGSAPTSNRHLIKNSSPVIRCDPLASWCVVALGLVCYGMIGKMTLTHSFRGPGPVLALTSSPTACERAVNFPLLCGQSLLNQNYLSPDIRGWFESNRSLDTNEVHHVHTLTY